MSESQNIRGRGRGRRPYNQGQTTLRQEDGERDQRDASLGTGSGRGGGAYQHHGQNARGTGRGGGGYQHRGNNTRGTGTERGRGGYQHRGNNTRGTGTERGRGGYQHRGNNTRGTGTERGRGGYQHRGNNTRGTGTERGRGGYQHRGNNTRGTGRGGGGYQHHGHARSLVNAIPQTVISSIQASTTLISAKDESAPVIKQLMTQSFVALDCEGHNLTSRYGKLATIQIGTLDGKAFIFDIVKSPELVDELKDLLESKTIVKIIQDCRGEAKHFDCHYKICLNNVFDTQCAHIAIEQEAGRLGKDNIGLNDLCEIYGAEINHFKAVIKKSYKGNSTLWLKRPMTREMILYAASDVKSVTTLYLKLKDKVNESERFKQLCSERTYFHRLVCFSKDDIKKREHFIRYKIQLAIDSKRAMEKKALDEANAQNQNEGSKSEHEDERKEKPKTSQTSADTEDYYDWGP